MLVRSGLEVGREGDEGGYEGCSCWGFQRCGRGAGLVGVGGSAGLVGLVIVIRAKVVVFSW